MRNLFQLLVALPLLVVQVASSLPNAVTAQVKAIATTGGSTNKITLDTNSIDPINLNINKPDFDREVLAPLRAAQATKAAADAARAKASLAVKRTIQVARPVIVATGDVWNQLRLCEAGGDYTRNSGNGFYGAYQYDLGTWANFQGYARPDLAPPAVQDQKAHETQAARGWYPWPACSHKLGLL